VPDVRLNGEIFKKSQGCSIKPLEIVKKNDKRVFLHGKYGKESPNNRLEPVLCLLRRKLRDNWLFTDDQFKLGDQVGDELAVR
jgi:hypothetical protein